MQFSTIAVASTLLLGLASADPTSSSSARLARRHQDLSFNGTYIMKDMYDEISGHLPIYNPVGVETYRFNKWFNNRGPISVSRLYSSEHWDQPVITLSSARDLCGRKSHYKSETVLAGKADLRYTIDPRSVKSDVWNFKFVNPMGEEIEYYYKRNIFNKGGKVYQIRNKKRVAYVAKLQMQIRWESWLNPGSDGADTFTLMFDESAGISTELVALMGLVLTRVVDCGI